MFFILNSSYKVGAKSRFCRYGCPDVEFLAPAFGVYSFIEMFYLRFLGFSRNIKAKAKRVIEIQNRDTVDRCI